MDKFRIPGVIAVAVWATAAVFVVRYTAEAWSATK